MTSALAGAVAVTGATGFIGRRLVAALETAGTRLTLITHHSVPDVRGVRAHRVIEAGDGPGALADAVLSARPDVVLHLAGARSSGDGWPAATDMRANAAGTVEVLEAAVQAGARRIVCLGSAEEYGPHAGPVREDAPAAPVSAYGLSKLAATQAALWFHRERAAPVVVLRPFTVYGPGQPSHMFVAEAIASALGGEPFRMSAGTQSRDMVYVDDVVDAISRAAAATGVDGRIINVGTGRMVPLRRVAEIIWEKTRTSAALLVGARPAAVHERYDTCADNTLARELLGWLPTVPAEEGLDRTIAAAMAR